MTTPTNTSPTAELALRATHIELDDEAITARLEDGRTVRVPFTWFPRLAAATARERARWQFIGRGTGIHWPLLDEDVSVFSLVYPERTTAAIAPADAPADAPGVRRRAS